MHTKLYTSSDVSRFCFLQMLFAVSHFSLVALLAGYHVQSRCSALRRLFCPLAHFTYISFFTPHSTCSVPFALSFLIRAKYKQQQPAFKNFDSRHRAYKSTSTSMKTSPKPISKPPSLRVSAGQIGKVNKVHIDDDITESTTKCDESWNSLSGRSLASECRLMLSVDSLSTSARGGRNTSGRHFKSIRKTINSHSSQIIQKQTNVALGKSTANNRKTESRLVSPTSVTGLETNIEKDITRVAVNNPTAFSIFQPQSRRGVTRANTGYLPPDCRSIPNTRCARRYTSERTSPTRVHNATSPRQQQSDKAPFLSKSDHAVQRYPFQPQVYAKSPPLVGNPSQQSPEESLRKESTVLRGPVITKPTSQQAVMAVGCDRRFPRRAISEAKATSFFQPCLTSAGQKSSQHASTMGFGSPVQKNQSVRKLVHELDVCSPVARSYTCHDTLNQLLNEYEKLMFDTNE